MDHVDDSRITATAQGTPEAPRPPVLDLPDRFVPVRRLGGGGQGEVWLAEDRALEQRVALKVIRNQDASDARARIVQEARVGREVSHPNLIRVFDLLELRDGLVVVMEWLPGGSLKDRLSNGPLPIDEVLTVAEKALDVLGHLHDRGIVHRDVKPSNLLLDRSGMVKLADLGLVRHLDRTTALTRTGTAVGTPDYMSPEQLGGETAAAPTDLYGLGVTLYELLTGDRPFTGSSEFEVANRQLTEAPPSVRRKRPDCPRWLAAFVRRLLEKKPRDRWRDANEARAALKRRRAPLWRVWRRAALVACLLGAVALGALALAERVRPTMATAISDGADVVALDDDGAELWRHSFPARIHEPLVADVIGSPRLEVVVPHRFRDSESGLRRCGIVVYSDRGEERARLVLESDVIPTHYPQLSNELQWGRLETHDLDGDGRPELVWTAHHPDWYPTVVGAWWGRRGAALGTLFVNSGRCYDLDATDIDDDGETELVLTGVNNPLGYQSVLFVTETDFGGASPDLLRRDWSSTLFAYVPLGPEVDPAFIDSAGPGGISLRIGPTITRLGPALTPVDSSRETAWARRQVFWDGLMSLCRDLTADPARAADRWDRFVEDYVDVISTQGFRSAAALMVARSLARGSAHGEAITLLTKETAIDPEPADLWYRLGEQLLIAGRRLQGRQALLHSIESHRAGRSPIDAAICLTLDAALNDDESSWEGTTRLWDAHLRRWSSENALDIDTIWSFFRGEWRNPSLDQGEPQQFVKVVTVMRLWASLERGRDARTVASEAAALTLDAEMAEPARLLQALALVRAGEVDAAFEPTSLARETLAERARESHDAFVWLGVAEWVRGTVLEAAGEPDRAAALFERAHELAPGAWFSRD